MTRQREVKAAPRRGRGRPAGAFGKASIAQALEYSELLSRGIRPFTAAVQVAGNWQVSEHTVRKNAWRHRALVVKAIERDIEDIHYQIGLRLIGQYPEVWRPIAAAIERAGKRLEANCRALGSTLPAQTLAAQFVTRMTRTAVQAYGQSFRAVRARK